MNIIKLFQEILDKEQIYSVFQPIVNLRNGETIGYEALSRGPDDTELHSPIALIDEAKRQNKLFELEVLFRKKAITKASEQKINKLLFVNVDPSIINDKKFTEGFTYNYSEEHGIIPKNIIFEITERSSVNNYDQFSNTLKHYRKEGFGIAFDDTGAGFSNLFAISQINPEYIKIDLSLIRNIDKDVFKQSILKSFSILASLTNTKLIAEGIETQEELKTLINLGVFAGQGFFLGMPQEEIKEISEEITDSIKALNQNMIDTNIGYSQNIGEICEHIDAFYEDEKCFIIKKYLDSHQLEGVCVLNNSESVSGIVMKRHVDSILSRQYGFELFSNKPISKIVDTSCLIVDYFMPIQTVAELIFLRPSEKTYDNIIVTKNNKYEGIVSVINLLKYSMEIERSLALQLNPLTGLPGNVQISKQLHKIIKSDVEVCIVYFDLNNFKVYNDVYGFERGDAIIRMTRDLISNCINSHNYNESFIGHIGGDDFVAILNCNLEHCISICDEMVKTFDINVSSFFNETDRQNGYIYCKDRNKKCRNFPLTGIAIAGVFGQVGSFKSPDELARYISKIKKMAKEYEKSTYMIKDLNRNATYSGIEENNEQITIE
jgi:diguanylate cyclase (GGDEF)-like protein